MADLSLANCSESITLVVPGHGEAARSQNLLHSVHKLKSQWPQGCFVCSIFVYSPTRMALEGALEDTCTVTRKQGLWTDFMQSMQSPRTTYVILYRTLPRDPTRISALVGVLPPRQDDRRC